MVRIPRGDSRGVASSVATLLSLLVVLLFIDLAVFAPIPLEQYEQEWATSQEALEAFGLFRTTLAGPAAPGATFTFPVPLGTGPVSPFAPASPGHLTFDSAESGPTVSFRFVANFNRGEVTRVDQDVILLMDSSGSMRWNDPDMLRIQGAKEYLGQLRFPDRVAIVDFDADAHLTRANVGEAAHHLVSPGHTGIPDYGEAQGDLDTIDSRGRTNFGEAILIANDEFVAFGDPQHAWVMILLTDGQNNEDWQDDLAISEAQRAKALGITIYTIGLGSEPDEAVLAEIAATTGGTYYEAPNAESLHWIYLEISRRYQSTFACGDFEAAEAARGSLQLTLPSREYPPQTLRLEGGGIGLVQRDGLTVREGMPSKYRPTGPGSGHLSLSLMTLTGAPSSAAGTGYEIVHARVLAQDIVEQNITKIRLGDEANAIGNISAEVQAWADQGAATPSGASAVRAPLDEAQATVLRAQANATSGDIVGAKFDIDRAQAQLSEAIAEADLQAEQRQMQMWLAAKVRDDVLLEACRLTQWQNWYDGVTITVESPAAAGWAWWFNDTFSPIGASLTVGISGERAVVSVHAIDWFTLDRRIVQVYFGAEG